MKEFTSWRDILEWAKEHGYNKIVARMELNNRCWNSSGEFGRSQVAICDALRFAESEDEREEVADEIESELATDEVLEIIAG